MTLTLVRFYNHTVEDPTRADYLEKYGWPSVPRKGEEVILSPKEGPRVVDRVLWKMEGFTAGSVVALVFLLPPKGRGKAASTLDTIAEALEAQAEYLEDKVIYGSFTCSQMASLIRNDDPKGKLFVEDVIGVAIRTIRSRS